MSYVGYLSYTVFRGNYYVHKILNGEKNEGAFFVLV